MIKKLTKISDFLRDEFVFENTKKVVKGVKSGQLVQINSIKRLLFNPANPKADIEPRGRSTKAESKRVKRVFCANPGSDPGPRAGPSQYRNGTVSKAYKRQKISFFFYFLFFSSLSKERVSLFFGFQAMASMPSAVSRRDPSSPP